MKVEECVPDTSISEADWANEEHRGDIPSNHQGAVMVQHSSAPACEPSQPHVWAGGPHMPTVLCNTVLLILAEFKSHTNLMSLRSFSPHNEPL